MRETAAREVALLILDRLFGRSSDPLSDPLSDRWSGEGGVSSIPDRSASSSLSLVDFQREGADRVREILRHRRGAILADSVGLGKTYVALALIQETLAAGGAAVVVAPAAIRGLWRRALRGLPSGQPGRQWGGQPSGQSGVRQVVARGWRLVSHTQLARGATIARERAAAHPAPGGAGRLVVVDEAHRFRNPGTLRYTALARLVGADARVLLITATPVNNSPRDLLHLLRLFSPDDGFRDAGVPSLRDAFETPTGEAAGAGVATDRVAAVVRAVVVRRTRAMVGDRFASPTSGPRFPARAPPRVVRYRSPGLSSLVESLAALELRAYDSLYRDGATGAGATALLRLNLLKRLDSSPAAFRTSLARLDRLLRSALDAAHAGRVLATGARTVKGAGDDDPLQLTLIELVTCPAGPDVDLGDLIGSIQRDLARVREMVRLRGPGRDQKERALLDLLTRAGGEKVLVFTEYRDTAESLWRALAKRFPTGRVDGSGAWLGSRPAGRRTVVERFAPRANRRGPPPHRERVDVLVATDVLAEGLNLQDARHVVSYDLPWNPVRLLQRIGRVDRLGSPHSEIVPYLFAPDDGIEAMLGLTRRIRRKLGHMAATVGAEQADEILQRLGRTGRAGPIIEAEDTRGADDPIERLRTLWIRNRIAGRPRATARPGGRAGAGATTVATVSLPAQHAAAGLAWIVLVEQDGAPRLLELSDDDSIAEAGVAAAALLSTALAGEPSARPTGRPPAGPFSGPIPGRLPVRAIRDYLAGEAVSSRAPARLRRGDPTQRLARRIRLAMAREGAALDPGLVRRADALLARLSVPLGPVAEVRARALLEAEDGPLATLMDAAEETVAASAPAGAGTAPSPERGSARVEGGRPTIVCALRVHVPGAPAVVDASRSQR